MGGLLPALGSAFQLMLGHLWGTLLVVCESWTHDSGLPEFPWEILVCAMLLVLTVKRWHHFRTVKSLRKKSSAHEEICRKCSENVGPRAQADEALKPPRLEASPPTLLTLCLSAMNANLSGSLFQDTVDFLENAWNGQSSSLSQVTDAKHTFQASEDGGERPQKEEMSDLNSNVDFPESPEPSDQEIERAKQRVQEKEDLGGGPEPSMACKEPVLEDRVNRRRSRENLLTIFPLPELLRDWGDDGNPDIQDPKKELPGGITSLHAEEASLRCENSQLDSEIQLLRRKLQSLPDLHESHVMQIHRRLFKKEARCLQSKKKLLSVCGELNSVCQIRNLSKKIAGDLREELETTAACHRQEVRLCEERAQESWVAAERMERALSELTRENARLRQLLAQVEFNSQLSPRGLHAPAAPATARRGPQGSGEPLGHEAPPARGRVQP